MMWETYQISLRLLAPLHIGWRKSGNLQQTRPYVTGRALWGALTARLTRQAGHDDYAGVGTQVDKQLTFTYFYPSIHADRVALWPWGRDWDEFAWRHLGSYVSTALADGHSKEDGSLHETEFIAPRTREGAQVFLVGYIFIRAGSQLATSWEPALRALQLGGERGYGWGRVAYAAKQSLGAECCFGRFKLINNESRPALEACYAEAELLAHAHAPAGAQGEVEPLLGRITQGSSGFGGGHSAAEICWKPGRRIRAGQRFHICAKGIWRDADSPGEPDAA